MLRLVPGRTLDYKFTVSNSARRLESLGLSIQPGDDVGEIARILAQPGRPAQSIEQIIRSHLAKDPKALIPLQELLPNVARTKTNRYSDCIGPNCYNSVLNWHDDSVGIKATSAKEMESALQTLYERLPEGGRLRIGDLFVIRHQGELEHTAIYLGDNFLWEKPSSNSAHPWSFGRIEDTLQAYVDYLRPKDLSSIQLEFFRRKEIPALAEAPAPVDQGSQTKPDPAPAPPGPKLANISSRPMREILPWKLDGEPLAVPRFEVEQILPTEYITKLKGEGHELEVVTHTGRTMHGSPYLHVEVRTRHTYQMSQTVVQFDLHPHRSRMGAMVCENLRAQAPFRTTQRSDDNGNTWYEFESEKPRAKLRKEQRVKGVPPSVAAYTMRQVSAIAQAGGAHELVADGASTYAVARLYSRGFGMRPSTDMSRLLYRTIDGYYEFARTQLSANERPANVEAFQKMLSRAPASHQDAWKAYLQTGRTPNNSTLLRDKSGVLIGIRFDPKPAREGESAVYFVNPLDPGRGLLNWDDLHGFRSQGGMEFSMSLDQRSTR